MSQYTDKMEQESIERFNKEMQLRKFREQFKPQIESGLTLDELRQKRYMTDADVENFNIVEQEVKEEAILGDAFLKGFGQKGAISWKM